FDLWDVAEEVGISGGERRGSGKQPSQQRFHATMKFHGRREDLLSRIPGQRDFCGAQAETESSEAPPVEAESSPPRRAQVGPVQSFQPEYDSNGKGNVRPLQKMKLRPPRTARGACISSTGLFPADAIGR